MARKGAGKEAKLSHSGNLLVENRNGLIVDSRVWEATGTAERYAALEMPQEIPGSGRVTVGGGKGFDTARSAVVALNEKRTSTSEDVGVQKFIAELAVGVILFAQLNEVGQPLIYGFQFGR
jgi:hypothetical protein